MSAVPPLSRMRIFLLFFLAGAVLYFQTMGCPFLWDEYRLILGNAQAGDFQWDRLPDLFLHRYFYLPGSFKNDLPLDLPYYRPVTLLLHGLTYRAVGLFFPAYHLESIFLHVLNALLLFSLFTMLLRRTSPSVNNDSIALAGALLFLVHPRNVETVAIIANQTGLLCTFFCLLSLVFWARFLEGARRPLLLYSLSLASLLLAMLSKETAYGAPLAHAIVLFLLRPRGRKGLFLLAGFFLLAGIPLVARRTLLGGQSILEAFVKQLSRQGSAGGYIVSVLGLLFHQLYTWLVPLHIDLFQVPFSLSEVSLQQVLLPTLALAVCGLRLRRRTDILVLGLGWFFIFYLPSSNLISIGTLPGGNLKAGAHHLYPAHAGLCLLLAASMLPPREKPVSRLPSDTGGRPGNRTPGAGRLQWAALALLVLLLGGQAFRFARHYRTADGFYRALLDMHPRYTSAWTNYAWHKLYIDKDPGASERILLGGLEAVASIPNDKLKMDFLHNLMVLWLENGRPIEAKTMLQCVMDRWILRPSGNLYFWHMVRQLHNHGEDPSDGAVKASGPGP